MREQMLKYFKIGNIAYLVLLCVDLIVELFQVDKTSTVITLFGIKIISRITSKELNTTFLLDSRMILSYIATILSFLMLGYIINTKRKNNT